ncbi:DUF1127 domain-containing protein [Vibrio sp. PP-XX7]
MRHSLYLSLATLLIRADLRREERRWKRKVRACDIPWGNAHLLRDIGLESNGYHIGECMPEEERVARRVRSIRRLILLRIPT